VQDGRGRIAAVQGPMLFSSVGFAFVILAIAYIKKREKCIGQIGFRLLQ
jgi:hypothetical protein